MSKQVQNQEEEISLNDIKNTFINITNSLNSSFFSVVRFILKKYFIIVPLFIIGIGLGYFLDNYKKYEHEIILIPNFSSVDYLYEKIDLLNSKVKALDTLFAKEHGIANIKNIKKIEITPILDVYKFAQSNAVNLEMIKLMTDDIAMNDIIEGNITKRSYVFHKVTISTKKKIGREDVIEPILHLLNDTDYFKSLQKEAVENTKYRLMEIDSTMVQLNGILDNLAIQSKATNKNDNLVYYNENNKINDLFYTKDRLTVDRGILKANLISFEKVIKDIAIIENKELKKIKMPLILVMPVFLILFYLFANKFFTKFKNSL